MTPKILAECITDLAKLSESLELDGLHTAFRQVNRVVIKLTQSMNPILASTIRVRIAASVSKDGEWRAIGSSEEEWAGQQIVNTKGIAPGDRLCIVDADLPLPEIAEVQGVVRESL